MIDNHLHMSYICKDSHVKHGSKSNTNSQLQSQFSPEFELFSTTKIYANNGGHFKIVSIIKKH